MHNAEDVRRQNPLWLIPRRAPFACVTGCWEGCGGVGPSVTLPEESVKAKWLVRESGRWPYVPPLCLQALTPPWPLGKGWWCVCLSERVKRMKKKGGGREQVPRWWVLWVDGDAGQFGVNSLDTWRLMKAGGSFAPTDCSKETMVGRERRGVPTLSAPNPLKKNKEKKINLSRHTSFSSGYLWYYKQNKTNKKNNQMGPKNLKTQSNSCMTEKICASWTLVHKQILPMCISDAQAINWSKTKTKTKISRKSNKSTEAMSTAMSRPVLIGWCILLHHWLGGMTEPLVSPWLMWK